MKAEGFSGSDGNDDCEVVDEFEDEPPSVCPLPENAAAPSLVALALIVDSKALIVEKMGDILVPKCKYIYRSETAQLYLASAPLIRWISVEPFRNTNVGLAIEKRKNIQ